MPPTAPLRPRAPSSRLRRPLRACKRPVLNSKGAEHKRLSTIGAWKLVVPAVLSLCDHRLLGRTRQYLALPMAGRRKRRRRLRPRLPLLRAHPLGAAGACRIPHQSARRSLPGGLGCPSRRRRRPLARLADRPGHRDRLGHEDRHLLLRDWRLDPRLKLEGRNRCAVRPRHRLQHGPIQRPARLRAPARRLGHIVHRGHLRTRCVADIRRLPGLSLPAALAGAGRCPVPHRGRVAGQLAKRILHLARHKRAPTSRMVRSASGRRSIQET